MRLPIVRHIFGKEMLDTLRDKRTLIMMLGVPIVLYPALLIVGLQAALLQQSQLEESESRIAIRPPVPSELRTWIAEMPKATIVEPEAIDVARPRLCRLRLPLVQCVLDVRNQSHRTGKRPRNALAREWFDVAGCITNTEPAMPSHLRSHAIHAWRAVPCNVHRACFNASLVQNRGHRATGPARHLDGLRFERRSHVQASLGEPCDSNVSLVSTAHEQLAWVRQRPAPYMNIHDRTEADACRPDGPPASIKQRAAQTARIDDDSRLNLEGVAGCRGHSQHVGIIGAVSNGRRRRASEYHCTFVFCCPDNRLIECASIDHRSARQWKTC